MAHLRKRDTGAVTDWLSPDSLEYQALRAMKFQNQVTAAAAPTGTGGLISGETPGVINAGQPVWEEIAEEDAQLEAPGQLRVGVLALGSAATAAAETSSGHYNSEVAGNLTDVEYVADPASTGIQGQATNNRVVTLQQVTEAGTATVTRTVTALASVTFGAGTNATPGVPTPMTIAQAAFAAGEPLEVVSSVNGTGLPDPGGVVYFVYTRA